MTGQLPSAVRGECHPQRSPMRVGPTLNFCLLRIMPFHRDKGLEGRGRFSMRYCRLLDFQAIMLLLPFHERINLLLDLCPLPTLSIIVYRRDIPWLAKVFRRLPWRTLMRTLDMMYMYVRVI